jgi:glucose/arabinose dehydrogenase
MRRFSLPARAVALCLSLASPSWGQDFVDGPPAAGQTPAFKGQTRAPALGASAYQVETVASGLDHPWSLAWLPDGRMLVTERPGRLRIVGKDGKLFPPLAGMPQVVNEDQGGLLDVALDPAFAANGLIYFTYLEPRSGGDDAITIARARLANWQTAPQLDQLKVLLRTHPPTTGGLNVGSRLAFGPDGKLYVTIGDRAELRDQAQSLASDLGKVLRINPDGSIPKDNPFVGQSGTLPEIYSLGHRNPEGLAVQPGAGALWELEHGAKGGDEVNLVQPGRNYGWPVITYGVDYSGEKIGIGTKKPGLEQPVYYWDPSIAPSGLTFYNGALFPSWKGCLFVGALKAERLVRLRLAHDRVIGEEVLLSELHERIRDVRQGPDGALYVLTDNTAGRILKLVPGAGKPRPSSQPRTAHSSSPSSW